MIEEYDLSEMNDPDTIDDDDAHEPWCCEYCDAKGCAICSYTGCLTCAQEGVKMSDDFRKESFFGIFNYDHINMQGCDKVINLEMVKITRDIPSLGLKKGDEFETCWWYVDVGVFHFINWQGVDPTRSSVEPSSTSFEVNQFRLAPYMVWYDEDLPSDG